MRLTKKEIAALTEIFSQYCKNFAAELRLYGSRVNDDAKGGDIDLLLLTATDQEKRELLNIKYEILSKIKEKIGEQKIDLKIASTTELTNDPFLQIIIPTSEIISRFNTK